ncbi:LysR family transcriptional regulator [Catenovulum agarivorans DS-2]|uniref:LysR family transcriptional regulator n=2 Tax=Catenovulum agarivorans TaxID=1172192 RepID=W7R225_9ALTE|nr:LysR family transcriptional regulator [Catenovulum agarivorans DS-2]
MQAVVAVVETGSFTAASERLGFSKALVSKYVGEIEAQLKVRLFNRTTRRISLTSAGQQYYAHAIQMLGMYQQMLDDVRIGQSNPSGKLRISAPHTFADVKLSPVLGEFLARYPDLSVDLIASNRAVDMVEEGIDARIRVGSVQDSSLIAKRINTCHLVVCASPWYLNQFGEPAAPEKLVEHACLVDKNLSIANQWPFTDSAGQKTIVQVNARFSSNSPKALAEMAAAGNGIALVTQNVTDEYIIAGKLVRLFSNYVIDEFNLYVLYPHRKYVPLKLRCFLDFMQEKFGVDN